MVFFARFVGYGSFIHYAIKVIKMFTVCSDTQISGIVCPQTHEAGISEQYLFEDQYSVFSEFPDVYDIQWQ